MKNQVLSIDQMQRLKELGIDTSKASMVIIARDEDGDEIKWSDLSYEEDTCAFMYDSWHDGLDYAYKEEAYLEYLDAEDGEYDHSYRKENGTFTLQDIINILPGSIDNNVLTIRKHANSVSISYEDTYTRSILSLFEKEDIIETTYEMLVWCVKNGYVKTNNKTE